VSPASIAPSQQRSGGSGRKGQNERLEFLAVRPYASRREISPWRQGGRHRQPETNSCPVFLIMTSFSVMIPYTGLDSSSFALTVSYAGSTSRYLLSERYLSSRKRNTLNPRLGNSLTFPHFGEYLRNRPWSRADLPPSAHPGLVRNKVYPIVRFRAITMFSSSSQGSKKTRVLIIGDSWIFQSYAVNQSRFLNIPPV